MSTALALSNQGQNLQMALLDQLGGELRSVLPANIAPERLILTLVQCGERNPALYECKPQSLQLAALSMGTMNLECDGFSGQGYLIPFKRVATPVIGYKGYNTLAARNGFSIAGNVVRDGDRFEYELGTHPYVKHEPMLRAKKGQIIAAYAIAARPGMSPLIRLMDIDELASVKAKAPGARKSDSPWNDQAIGFPAMCEKTVKRRLARDVPQGWVPVGDTFEQTNELVGPAVVHMEHGTPAVSLQTEFSSDPMVDREGTTIEAELVGDWEVIVPGYKTRQHNGPTRWASDFQQLLHRYADGKPEGLEELWKANEQTLVKFGEVEPDKAEMISRVYEKLISSG